jgi:phenylacetate-coenzyme A ligase PaaK-like adenylate-forming protein
MSPPGRPKGEYRSAQHEGSSIHPPEPVRASIAWWNWVARASEIWWTRSAGRAAIDAAARHRFDALVQLARTHSPFYRDLYRGLPQRPLAPSELPVVTKRALMARFDDWVTDPDVKLAGVEAFLADRGHIGERYLDRFVVWKSSGSTGVPGIYVQDDEALATFDALMAAHVDPVRFAAQFAGPLLTRGGRAALVAATGEHFASIASWQRVCQSSPWIAARGFSIMEPLPRLVAELNEYQPVFLASYPSMLALLADEQEAGRLRITPLTLWSGGERLPAATQANIERAFGCRLLNEYGASECMSIAYGCREGWLHVNADWVLLEPVDRDYLPTRPGHPSHTVLLTNLANRVQPIIRYDLGDSVSANPCPCACGNPLPAIEVEGRHDDIVALVAPDGTTVRLLPLALTTVVEEAAHVHRFQIVQTAADRLQLRLDPGEGGARKDAWRAAAGALRAYLDRQSLPNVHVGLDRCGPLPDRRSGKLREVVVAMTEPPVA